MSPSPELETRPQISRGQGHDYINQAVVDMVLSDEPQGNDYINQEVVDMVLNEPAGMYGVFLAITFDITLSSLATAFATSNGYRNKGDPSLRYVSSQRQQPVALLDQDNMGEFEKRLLLAKNKSKASMPDLYKVPYVLMLIPLVHCFISTFPLPLLDGTIQGYPDT